MDNQTVICDFCKKSLTSETILKHIGNRKKCAMHYGPKFTEMKRIKSHEKIKKWRQENRAKELKRQRELYSTKPEKKDEKRMYYEGKKSEKAKKEGWNYTSNYEFKKQMLEQEEEEPGHFKMKNDQKVPCDFCKKNFMPKSILVHIGKNDECRNHYGPRFDKLKRENNRKRVQVFREKYGTRTELDEQKKSYNSDPELREKKKKRYQEEKEQQKIWEKEDKKRRLMESAQESLDYKEPRAREKNKKCLEWMNKSFEKIFQKLKNFDNKTREKVIILESRIEKKK